MSAERAATDGGSDGRGPLPGRRLAPRSSPLQHLPHSAPVRFLAALFAFAAAPASRPVRTHTRAHERDVGERGSRREAAGCAPAIVQLAQCHVCVRPSTCGSRARSPGPPSSIMCCCDFRVLRARRGGPRCLRRRASHGNTTLSRGCAHIRKLVVARSMHAHTDPVGGARAAGGRGSAGGWVPLGPPDGRQLADVPTANAGSPAHGRWLQLALPNAPLPAPRSMMDAHHHCTCPPRMCSVCAWRRAAPKPKPCIRPGPDVGAPSSGRRERARGRARCPPPEPERAHARSCGPVWAARSR